MKRKITRLARAAKCGGLAASGSAMPLSASAAAAPCDSFPSNPNRATCPNPQAAVRRTSRREKSVFMGRTSTFLKACASISLHVQELILAKQRLTIGLPGGNGIFGPCCGCRQELARLGQFRGRGGVAEDQRVCVL